MNENRSWKTRALAAMQGASVALMLMAVALPVSAQQAKASVPAQEDETHKPGSVQVHGHWELTVVNPDGTVAEKRAFHNSLSNSGGALLAQLLSGKWSQGHMGVGINLLTKGFDIYYIYSGDDCTGNIDACSSSLTATSAAGVLTLAGTIPARNVAYSLADVLTESHYCTSYSSGCSSHIDPANQGFIQLTGAVLSTPLQVAAYQAVQVKVTISFT